MLNNFGVKYVIIRILMQYYNLNNVKITYATYALNIIFDNENFHDDYIDNKTMFMSIL
jgi:hypothetical protein